MKRGKTQPSMYLTNPFAAMAEAPFVGPYVSTRYNEAEICQYLAKETVAKKIIDTMSTTDMHRIS